MKTHTRIQILIVILLLFSCSIDKCYSQNKDKSLNEYIHPTYKYKFYYPDTLGEKLYNNRILNLTISRESKRSRISVRIEGEVFDNSTTTFKTSYLDFIRKIANRNLSSDGPNGSHYCDSILNIKKLKNTYGIEYTKFDALITHVSWLDDEYEQADTTKYVRGPIYIIQLPDIEGKGKWRDRAITIMESTNKNIELVLLKTIIDSFEFIE